MGRCDDDERAEREKERVTLFSSSCFCALLASFPLVLARFFSRRRNAATHSHCSTKKIRKNPSKTPQQFELTDLSSPPLADDAAVARVLSRASDAPVALWVVSSGTQALGGVAKVRTG